MSCEINYKKVKINYKKYSEPIKLGCPFHSYHSSSKTRKYDTLKSLLFHLSEQHKNEGDYYPFSIDDVKSVMQFIALSLEWGLLK